MKCFSWIPTVSNAKIQLLNFPQESQRTDYPQDITGGEDFDIYVLYNINIHAWMAWSDPRQRGSFKFLCTCRSVISSFANGVKGLYSIQCQDLIGFVSSNVQVL